MSFCPECGGEAELFEEEETISSYDCPECGCLFTTDTYFTEELQEILQPGAFSDDFSDSS